MTELLPSPKIVEPPNCSCRGLSPQMNEHTASYCSILTTDELNALAVWAEVLDDAKQIQEDGPTTHLFGEQGAAGHVIAPDCWCHPVPDWQGKKGWQYTHRQVQRD